MDGKVKAAQVLALFTGITGLTVEDLLDAESETELTAKVSENIRAEHKATLEEGS